MRNRLNRKRSVLLGVIFLLSLFSFVYVNCPAVSGTIPQSYSMIDTDDEVYQEKLSPEVTAVKFMLGIASFIFTSDR